MQMPTPSAEQIIRVELSNMRKQPNNEATLNKQYSLLRKMF
jgi:hypothetical protein